MNTVTPEAAYRICRWLEAGNRAIDYSPHHPLPAAATFEDKKEDDRFGRYEGDTLNALAAKLPEVEMPVCGWTQIRSDRFYRTSCGADSYRPIAAGFAFCPFCGRRIETKERKP